jgi:hypothetical protein
MDRMHVRPESFRDVIEFVRYANTTGLIRDIAMKHARAAHGG